MKTRGGLCNVSKEFYREMVSAAGKSVYVCSI